MRPAAALLACAALFGCSRTPSPLTPGAHGSVGAPTRGVLRGGLELPRSGPGFEWLRPAGHHWGLPRVVASIEHAAAEVAAARPLGPPLRIGDLSARSGGEIPNHASHRSGRDADLLFYVTTPGGEPLPSPGFVRFGADGLAYVPPAQGGPRYVRFDLERNWVLVRSLVASPDANVQWLFVSEPLEARIVEYALALGEDADLVSRAEQVMQQPRDSLPHDDHFHLRSACLPEEALAGCEGGGPYWPWLPPLPAVGADEGDESLLAALFAPLDATNPRAARR